ncbi:molybdopterin-guanine dinucleotide biosynthesis protein B [Thermodesulfobacteriota bacterium]
MPPIVSIIGKSESGKTTLIEKLIQELKRRGRRIGIIKHASHGFDIDKKGKDSWRHKAAGADTVMVASPGRIAMVKDVPGDCSENELDRLEKYFHDMDLVITEGYKNAKRPKIEVFRPERHKEPVCLNDESLIAIVTDASIETDRPIFRSNDTINLADMIEKRFLSAFNGKHKG